MLVCYYNILIVCYYLIIIFLKASPLPPAPLEVQWLSSSDDQRIVALLRLVARLVCNGSLVGCLVGWLVG
jgi:hypothetical protein